MSEARGKGILFLIIAYVGINVFLWVGQGIYYSGTEKEIQANEVKMVELTDAIKTDESNLKEVEIERDSHEVKLEGMKERLDELKKMAGESKVLPEAEFEEYEHLRSEHNKEVEVYNGFVEKYDSLFDAYSKNVDKHNELVNSTNEKIKSIHKFYLIPIPLPKRALH